MDQTDGRQFVKYGFYKAELAWRRLPEQERLDHKRELAAVIDELSTHTLVRSYSLVGLRADADFLLWQASDSLDAIQETATRLRATALGGYLNEPYSYLAMTRRSEYVARHRHAGQEGTTARARPGDARYFIVYPFVKTREWYLLPSEERQRMMNDHFRVGHNYPSVRIHTSYSFGLDDQEFVVAFDTDSPSDFLDLVMDLRTVEGSLYTLRDTPIFTCIRHPIMRTLDTIDG